MTRSKRSGWYFVKASLPPPAVSTEWPSWVSIILTDSQTNGSSSTTRIRWAGDFLSASNMFVIHYRHIRPMLELLAIRGRKAPEDRAVEDAARGTELPELANGTLLRPFRALRPHSPYSQGVALGFIIAAPLGRALLATLGLIIAAPLGRFCWPDRVRGP